MNECKWCSNTFEQSCGPALKSEWKRYHCNNCGAFGYITNPSPTELADVYNSAWKDDVNSKFATGSTDEGIADSLLRAVGFPVDNDSDLKCLDYGGGSGHFARVLMNMKKTVTVFEPYGANPGLPEEVKWVNNLSHIDEAYFDWIFMVEVIEHLLDPLNELKYVYRYLKIGGILVITTPNAKGWRATMEKFNWREVQNPTHINLFSKNNLKNILEDAGFKNIKRIYHPVAYRQSGLKSVVLSLTQILGVDGGLRIIAERIE